MTTYINAIRLAMIRAGEDAVIASIPTELRASHASLQVAAAVQRPAAAPGQCAACGEYRPVPSSIALKDLDAVEAMLGGSNGPTIRIRSALARPAAAGEATPSLRAALEELIAAEDASEQLAVEWRKAENWSGLDAARAVPIQERIRNAWVVARTALAAGAAEPVKAPELNTRDVRDTTYDTPLPVFYQGGASMERPAASGSEQEPLRPCCYGGMKPKSACASCAAWGVRP